MNPIDPMTPRRDELIPTRWTLINRLKNLEDQTSWQDFFDTYWKLIYVTATRSGLSAEEAQDVVQETVITVLKKIHEFKADPGAGSFKSWLLNITRWRIVDLARKRMPQQFARSRSTRTSGTSTTERVVDPKGPGLDRIWNEEWQQHLITAAMEKLQRQTRSAKNCQIFFLYAIRNAAVEDVARLNGVKPEQVYVVKNRLMPLFEKAVLAVENNERI